jgi:hypothetical protein
LVWNGSTRIDAPSDGIFLLRNSAATDFTRLQFGGTTSSFPSLKRNAAGIDVRLADDSGYAALIASTITATSSANLQATVGCGVNATGTAYLSVKGGITGAASINVASGVAPTSPVNGDIWFDGTDIKMRIGGVTKTFTLT